MAQDKASDVATTPAAEIAPAMVPENMPIEAPPSYTPHEETPKAPISPPPTTPSAPERVYTPQGPFSSNLVEVGPDPANVICPRCRYGVRTQTSSKAGAHAG